MFILCWIFLFDAHMWINVFAQTMQWWANATSAATWLTGIDIIDGLLQIIYMIFYPLIFLAGLAMDNSLIYWEVFHLDVPLWKFWNIIKNLANFTLGFLVLFTILKNVFSLGKKVEDVKKIVTSTLIAGVLIQASWFLTAAMIDLSTVATYGIWALPMSVLKWSTIWDQKILAVDSVMDLDKKFDNNQAWQAFMTAFRVKYNDKDVLLSPCKLKRNWTGDGSETYIIWRKYYDAKYQNYDIFGQGKTACVINSKQVVIYNEFDQLKWKIDSDYENSLNWILSVDNDRRPWEFCGYMVSIKGNTEKWHSCWDGFDDIRAIYKDQLTDWADNDLEPWLKPTEINWVWIIAWDKWFQSPEVKATTISQLVDRSKGLVWPMMTIFSSMMNFAQISENSQDNGIGAIWMETLIKALFAIAIFFPLLALTLVLVARVWILRLVVAASPFIILLKIFKEQLGKAVWSIAEQADLGNIIKIIFSPVIIVFALSMSIIFMQTLISGFNSTGGKNCDRQKEIWESMMISPIYTAEQEKNNNCTTDKYSFLGWLITIKATWTFDRAWTGDLLSRTMVNIMAIALVWFLLFAAIKASSKLGEVVWKWVQDFWTSVMWSMPIMPIWSGVWVWTLKDQVFGKYSWDAIWNRKLQNIEATQEEEARPFFEWDKNKWKGDDVWIAKLDEDAKKQEIVKYVQTTSAPTIDGVNTKLWDNNKVDANYMTDPTTLKAFEELQKKITDGNDKTKALTWIVTLLASSIDEKVKTLKNKDELKKILQPIYDAKDNISIKYVEGLIANSKEFEVWEWATKKKYIIEKNGDKFELKEVQIPVLPTPPATIPTTTTTTN